MNAFKQFWLQYADFSGRTSRAHFWLAFFWNFLISLPLWVFFIVADVSHQAGKDSLPLSNLQALPVLWSLAFLVFFYFLIFVPSQAICVRRLRDAGIHWSWIFLNLGPILFYLVTSRGLPLHLAYRGSRPPYPFDVSSKKRVSTASRSSNSSGY